MFRLELDASIRNLLQRSCGLTYAEIKKSLGLKNINDKTFSNSLKRLQKYKDIRTICFNDYKKPRKIYVSTENDKAPLVCTWLRREVLLDDGTPCYYDVYLDCFGDKIDHDLVPNKI